jgi:proteasome assembly chaperone (PAC2) family protein
MDKVWVRYLKKPRLRKPIVIAAAQGLRSVGKAAVEYLVKELKPRPRLFAELYCVDFCVEYLGPSYLGYPGLAGAEVVEGVAALPRIKFYWHDKPELIITDGYQALYSSQYRVARRVAELYAELGARLIISLGAHVAGKGVQCLSSDRQLVVEMKKHGIEITKTEKFIGFSGLVLMAGKKLGIPALGLLAETTPAENPEAPDPRASKALLEKLGEILGVEIDTSRLVREEEPAYIL